MSINIQHLNHNQLNELIGQAKERQVELRREKLTSLRQTVRNLIKDEGYSIEDVFPGTKNRSQNSGTVPPKFRNPYNPNQTWSGRGKPPHWYKEALSAGSSIQNLEI